jgi:hypothetical protein
MSPVYLTYLANLRKELSRKTANTDRSFKCDIVSNRPAKPPIIV